MAFQPKTEPVSPPGFPSMIIDKNYKGMSISELVSVLRSAYEMDDFDRVEEELVSRDAILKAEIGQLQEKIEEERQYRIKAEEQLKRKEEQCERGKRAQESYEKLLKRLKTNGSVDNNTTGELRNTNLAVDASGPLFKVGPRKEQTTSSGAAGKRPREESSSNPLASPERSSFRSRVHQERFEVLKEWPFITERQIKLMPGEYEEFNEEITRRRWRKLATPMEKFDPSVVREFYANAWPLEAGKLDMRSKVRGRWVPYDRDAINELLGNPFLLEEGQQCTYLKLRRQIASFNDFKCAQKICFPDKSYAANHADNALRILRSNMTSIAQMWMSFMLANIVPLSLNSDLTMPWCYLMYCILNQYNVDIAAVISDTIHQFVLSEPGWNPDHSHKPLGFPALITALCVAHGVEVTCTQEIRPPIDRRFIEKNCINPAEKQGAQPDEAPASELPRP